MRHNKARSWRAEKGSRQCSIRSRACITSHRWRTTPAPTISSSPKTLGLRRVKKTVNFDSPDVYHLYYGDEAGTPGTVMTYFPFPQMPRGRAGTGEVGTTVFSVPEGALGFWRDAARRASASAGLKR